MELFNHLFDVVNVCHLGHITSKFCVLYEHNTRERTPQHVFNRNCHKTRKISSVN